MSPSLRLLNFAIFASSLCLALSLASASDAQSVVDDDPNRVSITIRKDQAEEALKNIKKANAMNAKARKMKALTDGDIAWISNLALQPGTPPAVKFNCLIPLQFLDPSKMAPGQLQQIERTISSLLSENDEKTDPAGMVKANALHITRLVLLPQHFAADIKRLSRDKRQSVKAAAELLLPKLR